MTDVRSFDGTRLALTTWGPAEAPVVVLVHGLGMSTETWGEVPGLLADRYRVVAYDLRGHAQSGDARGGDYSMAAHARDLAAVLDCCVPAGGRAVVVGHSMGGGIILVAAGLPAADRMGGAVFAGSSGSAVTFPGFPARWLPSRLASWLGASWFRALRIGVLLGRGIRRLEPVTDRAIARLAFGPDGTPDLVAGIRDELLGTRPLALAGSTFANIREDWTRLASGLRVPTLVVRGTEDPRAPRAEVDELLARLPDGELVELPGAGHMLPLTQGPVIAEQVARWGDRVVLGTGSRGGTEAAPAA